MAVILFLFLFWRRLKEDYTQNQIFTTAFYTLLGFSLGSIVSDNFAPDWWFWTSFLGGSLGIFVGTIRFNLRVFEALEAGILSSLILYGFVFFYNWINTNKVTSGLGALATSVLLIIFVFLDRRYKTFSWYKSGKVGFSGMTVLGSLFLVRAIIATRDVGVLSFVGNKDVVLSAIVSFVSFLILFNLARSS
ncbi:MAG: hypothetical protein UT19_C0012G0009 [Candidatus Woesebacteria bacterium GW2011_GWB1_39_10b]|uniref:Uncharacterized protein n=2 Tax=Candidatus Woeseibacteriota TaxID=1752722 RepID=A0A0G0NDA5_9BACT|nr:MAG: hypothetical protein US72_C0013G0028 [Microgenomates group bacterium GW2011_GWC1_38_12]KKQ93420.1 MAG: hypothetical protein UT19_C0012G0009 [Candidatus Woesebacteria bacterium GW2011_GWB1_39_10b]KKR13488.1 MAG: hypothetical protein UT40_C0016G0019 [Candidatus Woesebacteria bacterium GW2011_GWA1_39_21b]